MSGAPPAAGGGAANSSTTSLARTSSTLSGRSSLDSSAAGSTAPSTRRSVPPAFGSKPSPVSSAPPIAARPPPPAAAAATETATLLYDFAPSSESELACSAGEVVEVLEPEDENGWLRCRSPRDGGEGLVPASYVQMGGALADGGEDGGGADAAQRGAFVFAQWWRSAPCGLRKGD